MTAIRLTARALTRCRFAISPLAETVSTLTSLERGDTLGGVPPDEEEFAAYRTWRDGSEPARSLLTLVASTKWMPDFLAVPPLGGLATRIEDELDAVGRFTDAQVRETLALAVAASWAEPVPDIAWSEADDLAAIVVWILADGWHRFVATQWPRRRAILERDVARRAEWLSASGWRSVIETISRNSSWVGTDTIEFGRASHPARVVDDGIVFVPHTQASGAWSCEQPPHFGLVYPAWGRAAAVDVDGVAQLSRMLGSGRARVLSELRIPATSSELASILGVSLGTVSAHLATLRAAGVVSGLRTGRQVRYRLTARGSDLLGLFDGGAAEAH